MNEIKKSIIIGVFIVAVILFISGAAYVSKTQGDKIIKAVDDLFAEDAENLVYIGRPTCSYCAKLQPVLDDFVERYNFNYHYVNIDKLSQSQIEEVIGKFGLTLNEFGTPYLAVVDNGKIVDEQPGYVEADGLFAFLQDNGFIPEDAELSSGDSNLTMIDYDEYNKLISGDSEEIIVIAQTGCGACETAKPYLEEISNEDQVKINWFDIVEISDDEYDAFMESLDYLQEEEWGTPLTIVVKNNEVIDAIKGAVSKESFIDFFKENGFIE